MSGSPLKDIRSLSSEELEGFLLENQEKKFRAKQIHEWIWKKGCRSFNEMTNLSASLRAKLTSSFIFPTIAEGQQQTSQDGTLKMGFRLHDDLIIEGVLIPSEGRSTACISTQAGCALGCTFCATGTIGLYRNLTATEIFDQVWLLNEKSLQQHQVPLSNIVFMGMGEPLFNYQNVKRAIDIITDPDGMGVSPQRLTISSVGVPKIIRQLADDQVKVNFAISLHAANDQKRNSIIPFNKQHPISDLIDSLKYYHQQTGKRFTIEYLLLKDFNDTLDDAKELAVLCRNFPVKINLIEFNPISGIDYQRSDMKRMKEFKDFLESRNMIVNIRKSRGKDIDAACGQLAGKA